MYREESRLPARRVARFGAPIAVALLLLVAVLALAPLPAAARLIIGVAGLLYLAAAGLWVASLSRVRVVLDAEALTVARPFLVARRYPLERIASCAPIAAPVVGPTSRRVGPATGAQAAGASAVLLRLTDGSQVAFPSGTPDALCAALRARRPAIAVSAADSATGRPSREAAPGSWRAAAEAESREWMVRCARCKYERSAWDWGWTIWKGAGIGRRYLRCPSCVGRSWHTITRVRKEGGWERVQEKRL